MKRRWAVALFLPSLSHCADHCVDACRNTFQAVQFSDGDTTAPWQCRERGSEVHFTSLYLCVREHCSFEARVEGLEIVRRMCAEEAGVEIPAYEIVNRFTDEDLRGMGRFELNEPGLGEPLDTPVLPTGKFYQLWVGTLDATEYVHYYHFNYGFAMMLFWIGVVAVGMIHRGIIHFQTETRSEDSRTWLWMKSRIFTPAMFGHQGAHNFGGWATIPPRMQSLTISLFILMNIAMTVHGYNFFPGNIYYPAVSDQVLRYISDRTGIISFANFPLIWLFGMRNNVVIWLTGWDFGTYNSFHRWVARVATLQAVIHSLGYSVLIIRQGGWSYFAWWWTLMFWWAGELATIFMCALLGFSFYWIRRQQYELFLIVHIILSVLVLLTMLGHVSIFSGKYDALVWIPASIWLFDRVIRIARILAFNPRFWNTKAQATFNPPTNMVRLQIPSSTSVYTVEPGTYYYLMFLNGANFWESHPFTVADVGGKMMSEEEPLLRSDEKDSKTLTFLIRPYDSITSRLRHTAAAQWPMAASVRVLVDGPYGHTQPLHTFDQVVFIVGGSGIVVPLSYMQRFSASQTKVSIHWSVREAVFAEEILSRDLGEMEVDVYLTADSHGEIETRPEVRWHARRMDAFGTVKSAGRSAERILAVVACGPAQMAAEARKATVDLMKRGRGRVEYFEESFQW